MHRSRMPRDKNSKPEGRGSDDVERAFLHEQEEANGTVLVRCLRCHAIARRGAEEAAYSVRPRHRPSCPLDER